MWGISDEEVVNPYTPVAAATPNEHEEGEVIESVLDHRRKQNNSGKNNNPISISKV